MRLMNGLILVHSWNSPSYTQSWRLGYYLNFFSSIKEKAQLGLDNDNKLALLKLFLKTELSGKTYVQFYPNAEKEKEIEDMKTYDKLFVREAHADIEYKPELATKKEDDLYVYLYHLDKLVYKLEKE